MRYRKFRTGKGNASGKAREHLEELLVITEAAIVRTNVTRELQQRLESAAEKQGKLANIVPLTTRETAKREQYEVSVVDEFIQAGGASFAYHGSVAIWERQVKERAAGKGSHPAIDVALFNANKHEESRIEFGYYTKAKLEKDARKLHRLSKIDVPAGGIVSNYLILWKLTSATLTGELAAAWFSQCQADAKQVAAAQKFDVAVAVASSQDVFVSGHGKEGSRVLQVALFEVAP